MILPVPLGVSKKMDTDTSKQYITDSLARDHFVIHDNDASTSVVSPNRSKKLSPEDKTSPTSVNFFGPSSDDDNLFIPRRPYNSSSCLMGFLDGVDDTFLNDLHDSVRVGLDYDYDSECTFAEDMHADNSETEPLIADAQLRTVLAPVRDNDRAHSSVLLQIPDYIDLNHQYNELKRPYTKNSSSRSRGNFVATPRSTTLEYRQEEFSSYQCRSDKFLTSELNLQPLEEFGGSKDQRGLGSGDAYLSIPDENLSYKKIQTKAETLHFRRKQQTISSEISSSYIERKNLTLHGYLEKKTRLGSWQRRFFEVHSNHLLYYRNRKRRKVLADLDLNEIDDIRENIQDPTGSSFYIEVAKKQYFLRAENSKQRKKWVVSIDLMCQASLENPKEISSLKMSSPPTGINRSRTLIMVDEDFRQGTSDSSSENDNSEFQQPPKNLIEGAIRNKKSNRKICGPFAIRHCWVSHRAMKHAYRKGLIKCENFTEIIKSCFKRNGSRNIFSKDKSHFENIGFKCKYDPCGHFQEII